MMIVSPLLANQLLEDLHHDDAIARVEVPGWLVGQDDPRIVRHRASNRHPLLLPTRQLVRTPLTRSPRPIVSRIADACALALAFDRSPRRIIGIITFSRTVNSGKRK